MITGGPLNHPRNNTYIILAAQNKAPDRSVAVAGYSSASQASANIERDSVSECRSTKSQMMSELGPGHSLILNQNSKILKSTFLSHASGLRHDTETNQSTTV